MLNTVTGKKDFALLNQLGYNGYHKSTVTSLVKLSGSQNKLKSLAHEEGTHQDGRSRGHDGGQMHCTDVKVLQTRFK